MFSAYPAIDYPFIIDDSVQYKLVRDITRNVRIRRDAVRNSAFYNLYTIKDGETPDVIAKRVYDNSDLFYLVMLANDIYDWRTDVPLTQAEFEYYMREHYVDPYAIHHYEDTAGNIIDLDNEETKKYRLVIHYVDEDGKKVADTYSRGYASGEPYEVPSPPVRGMYPSVDIVRGEFGRMDKRLVVIYRNVSIKFTLTKDRSLKKWSEDEYEIVESDRSPFPINGLDATNLFPNYTGSVPDGMLSVWINGEKTDQPWNSITANGGDTVEVRTNTSWMPIPNFGVIWGFEQILNRFPQFRTSQHEVATDFSGMFYNPLGSALKSVPSRLFENNPQVQNISNLFGNCMDLEGVPQDIFNGLNVITKADHCFNLCNCNLDLFFTTAQLAPAGVIDYSDEDDPDHNDYPASGKRYGSVEAFFNETPWNRINTHRVHVKKQTDGMKTFSAFQELAMHYMYVRNEKRKVHNGYCSLNVFYEEEFPEFLTIVEADNISELPKEDKVEAALDIIPITMWEYEERKNEARRRIRLIKPEYVQEIVSLMKTVEA